MRLATVFGIVAIAMTVLGIVAVFRQRAILASVLIVGGLVLGLASSNYLD
jgi:hypothetical protein